MNDNDDISNTTCALIPVYCYYDRYNGGEVKTPILLFDPKTFLLSAIILDIDPSIFTPDELKDEFLEAYYNSTHDTQEKGEQSLDTYDIYPQLVSILHTDNEELSIYVCELYENSEPYFRKGNSNQIADLVSYKSDIDELLKSDMLEPLTEKILITLSEERYITRQSNDDGQSSVELF